MAVDDFFVNCLTGIMIYFKNFLQMLFVYSLRWNEKKKAIYKMTFI